MSTTPTEPSEHERDVLRRAAASVELFVNPLPTISMGHFADGSRFRVEVRIDNLATERQAQALLERLRRFMCGDEITPQG